MKGRGVLSRVWVVGLVVGLLSVPMVAWADPILNTIEASNKTVATQVGSSVSVGFYATPSNTVPPDDASGCNATGSRPASVVLDLPVGVTVAGLVTLRGCGASAASFASFSADTPGNYVILVSDVTGGKDGSRWDLSDAGFILVVESAAADDETPPDISYIVSGKLGSNGWYASDVTVKWTVTDDESDVSSVSGCDETTIAYDTSGVTLTCTATSAGGTASESVTIKRDATPPTISGSASPAPNAHGWNKTDVTVSFTCGDNLSGVASCGPDEILSTEGTGLSVTGTAVDEAGNSATATVSGVNIDKTPPTVHLVGGPEDGASYYFGFVPAVPTCSASDALSGLDGVCSVSGYDTAVGTHTVTASATDKAGNAATDSRTYTVLAWTLSGFYRPLEMGDVWNTVKGGSTVPLKFEIFAGSTELTESSAIKSLMAQQVSCSGGSQEEEVEATATGGTSLRYDRTAGQFVYNWQTPKKPGTCHLVTMTTQDGSALVAYLKLK